MSFLVSWRKAQIVNWPSQRGLLGLRQFSLLFQSVTAVLAENFFRTVRTPPLSPDAGVHQNGHFVGRMGRPFAIAVKLFAETGAVRVRYLNGAFT